MSWSKKPKLNFYQVFFIYRNFNQKLKMSALSILLDSRIYPSGQFCSSTIFLLFLNLPKIIVVDTAIYYLEIFEA